MKYLFTVLLAFSAGTLFAQEETFEIVREKPVAVESVPAKEPAILTVVEQPAEFPGGKEALTKYLGSTIRYPESAVKKKLEGKCYVQFIVSENGSISNVKVRKGVTDCPECDQEAVRAVKAMPKWKPAMNDGKAVNSYFNLPIAFTL